jgi:hypothetical protein
MVDEEDIDLFGNVSSDEEELSELNEDLSDGKIEDKGADSPLEQLNSDNGYNNLFGESHDSKRKKVRQLSTMLLAEPHKLSKDFNISACKLPKFIGIQRKAFSLSSYNEEHDKVMYKNAPLVIRWKNSMKDSNSHLPHNAAIVKFDDGSSQLVVGNSVFNVKMSLMENW